jgi:phage terminase large subunit-like protein
VVAVDPAITAEAGSSETGIIVAGVDDNGQGYVLADCSLRASPAGWAARAIAAYDDWGADRIVVEANQGGDMVEGTLRAIDDRVSVRAVHATRGKLTRAEPIAALYEKGRVHHAELFPELEDQMCSWVPGDPSPDRMDALVWALTDLMLSPRRSVEVVASPFYG